MKNTRKLLAAVMALAMVSAIAPMSAFAVDDTVIKQDSTTKSGTMTATYDVTAKYTVTIPAGVTLDSTNAVSKKIEASDVMLESGKKIKVTLNSADHTTSGATFHAQTDKGDSTATYTISKGETAVAVGDTVAEFTGNGTQALTFSKAEGATYAGAHTETLTFTVSLEDAVTTKKLTITGEYFDDEIGGYVPKSLEIEYTDNDTWKDIAERYDEVSLQDYSDGPEGKIIDFWGIYGCILRSNESPYTYKFVSINDKVSAYSSYYLE